MRFTKLLSNLILEQSRFQVLFDKLVKTPVKGDKEKKSVMDFETLKALILADPTTKVPEGMDIDSITEEDIEKVKVGKFTNWIIKNFLTTKPEDIGLTGDVDPKSPEYKKAKKEFTRLFMEDLYKVTDDLRKFERNKQYFEQADRDISKFTPKTLFNFLQAFKLPEKKQAELEKKQAKKTRSGFDHAGGEIIHQGPQWTVIKISDQGQVGKDAAIWYGGFHEHDKGESRWCTSSPGLTYFNTYIKDGPLYVIFPNDDKGEVGLKTGLPKERYQWHFPSSQFMDRDDHQIKWIEYLDGPMSELKELFRPEVAKGLVKGGDVFEMKIGEGLGGQYIYLYGFDKVFDDLPENLVKIWVSNTSGKKIAYDVPDTIVKYKKVKTLMFQNCIKTLPENLGDMTSLSFISLPDNKELEKLPESIVKLDDLAFIALKNSNPNIQIPEELKKRLDFHDQEGFYSLI